jgi:hypothetical protein
MVGAAEGTGQARCGEGKREDLSVKGAHLRVGLHQRPGAALDFGESLQDFRPGASEDLDVTGGTRDAGRRVG